MLNSVLLSCTNINIMPIVKLTSPTLFINSAFRLLIVANVRSFQKPINKKLNRPISSQNTNKLIRLELMASRLMLNVNALNRPINFKLNASAAM